MARWLATVVAAALTVGLAPGWTSPAEAHRSKCLPGKLSHKQCHRTWKGARRIGIPKKIIKKKIWKHPKRLAGIPVKYKVSRPIKPVYEKYYGVNPGEFSNTKTVSAYVSANVWNRQCLMSGVPDSLCPDWAKGPVVKATWLRYFKTWSWAKKCCPVKKKSINTRFVQDVTAVGRIQGWNFRDADNESHGFKGRKIRAGRGRGTKWAKHFWHWSILQPHWEVCLPYVDFCVEDRTPLMHLWGGYGGEFRRWVDTSL
jgi:hypothetical protein